MVKKFFFVLSIFSLFLISSCADLNGGGYGKNNLTFEIGSKVSDSIVRTVTGNPDTTELTIECSLLRGEVPVKKESKKVQLSQLYKTGFSLTNIPNGNNYFISLDIYYKDYLIYTALSELIILNENQEEAAVKLSLKQNNSKITYELNGGNFSEGQKVYNEYFITSKAIIPEPVKKMSMFEGWYTNSSFTGEPVTELGQAKFIGDVTLYAKWREFGVKFEPNVDKVDYQDVIKLSCNVPDSKIYYTINGSQPTESSTLYVDGIVVDEAVVSERDDSIKINAIAVNNGDVSNVCSKTYTMKRYTVTLDNKNLGTLENKVYTNMKKGDKIQLPSLNETDYTFENWQLNGTAVKNPYEVIGDVTLTANWTALGALAKVEFTPSQQLDSAGTIDFGETIELSCKSPDVKIYYTTDGSDPSLSSNSGRIEYKSQSPISMENDVTIKAIAEKAGQSPSEVAEATYKLRKYAVTFNSNGHGTTPETLWLHKNYSLTAQDLKFDATNLGIQFNGWKDANGKAISADYKITGKLDLKIDYTDLKPGAVTDLSATTENGAITLSWTNPPDADIDKVIITCDDTSVTIDPVSVAGKAGQSLTCKVSCANEKVYKFELKVADKADSDALESDVQTLSQRLYVLTESPVVLTDYNSKKNPTVGTPTGSNGKWEYMAFGDWPQTIKDSSGVTLSTSTVDVNGWPCYYGSDGYYYVKVTAEPYGTSYKFTDGTPVESKKVYYFKLEPIQWRVLTVDYKVPDGSGSFTSSNKKLLLAEKALANCPYFPFTEVSGERNISGESNPVKDCNYKYSEVRAFLNGYDYVNPDNTTNTIHNGKGFLQKAFTKTARAKIAETKVDNSAASTSDANGKLQESRYSCDNTQDKVFLLSEKEVTRTEYGFNEYNILDANRSRISTDYAKGTGVKVYSAAGNSPFWLRSPGENVQLVLSVDGNGNNVTNGSADPTKPNYSKSNGSHKEIAVVPALVIQ